MSRGLTGLCLSLFAPIGSRATMLGTTYSFPPRPPSAVPAWRVPVVTLSVTLVRLLPKEAQAEARMASDRALHRLFGFVLLGPKCLGPCPHGLPSPIPHSLSPVPYHNQVSFVYLFVCVWVCASLFKCPLCMPAMLRFSIMQALAIVPKALCTPYAPISFSLLPPPCSLCNSVIPFRSA